MMTILLYMFDSRIDVNRMEILILKSILLVIIMSSFNLLKSAINSCLFRYAYTLEQTV